MRKLLPVVLVIALLTSARSGWASDDLTIIETAQPAHDGWRSATNVFLFGYVLAAMVDDIETAHCLGQSDAYVSVGRPAVCSEANPLVRSAIERRGTVAGLAIKATANVSISAAVLAIRDSGHTKASAFTALGAFAAQSFVAWHNAKALGISFTVGGK